MTNDAHPIQYSSFSNLSDNVVQPCRSTWYELVALLGTHSIAIEDKAFLPAMNGWRYKGSDDPTVDKGTHKDGSPVKNFGPGVRRIQSNLVEMSLLILDFDGGMLLPEVQAVFGEYEYVCYTSFNHQVEDIENNHHAVDKFRVVLLLKSPMPIDKFIELKPAIQYWIDGDGPALTDPKTFSIGQIFILPAVREEHTSNVQAWRNGGKLLDWKMFESIKIDMPIKAAIQYGAFGAKPSGLVLKPDDVLDTANGNIMVRDIDRKISYVRCPFHADPKPSEFAGITSNGTPFLHCKKCGRAYMHRIKSDPIVAGIAKITEQKRLRAAREAK